jgi:hypothetical protein
VSHTYTVLVSECVHTIEGFWWQRRRELSSPGCTIRFSVCAPCRAMPSTGGARTHAHRTHSKPSSPPPPQQQQQRELRHRLLKLLRLKILRLSKIARWGGEHGTAPM